MTVSLMRFFWRMPKAHPTAATVTSGILGAVLFIEGIVLSSTTTSTGQTNVAAGILVCIFGLLTMGLAAYAAYDTQYFKSWTRPDGSYRHALVRWAGPLFLIVALVELILVFWIMSYALEGMSKK